MRYLAAAVLLSFGAIAQAAMPFVQGPKLVATNATGNAFQGSSVALSGDGNTAALGGPSDDANKGAAWVFTRNAGVWHQDRKLVGTGALGAARQGWSVSLSSDGDTLLVGGFSDNGEVGAAWVFHRFEGVWYQEGKLVGTGAVGAARQGWSVALSGDGDTAIVGGHFDNGLVGAAWVFTRTGGLWTQQGPKLFGSNAVGSAHQGVSVALSSNGNTAIVGGHGDDSSRGAAWVFTRTAGIWNQQGAKLVGAEALGSAWFGYSVGLSADGNTAVVGGREDDLRAGATWIFTRSGSVWHQQGGKLVGTGAVGEAHQGGAVAVAADGNTLIEGGFGDASHVGDAWAFGRSGGVWTQLGDKLARMGATAHLYQGAAVAVSGDGTTALVGGYGDDGTVGAAWVFTRSCAGGEVNGDAALNVGDVFYLINYLFAGGPAPGCY